MLKMNKKYTKALKCAVF
jgi:hypothetical protein